MSDKSGSKCPIGIVGNFGGSLGRSNARGNFGGSLGGSSTRGNFGGSLGGSSLGRSNLGGSGGFGNSGLGGGHGSGGSRDFSHHQSFQVAFADAHNRMGPGQTFQHKGKSYSTNRADGRDVSGRGSSLVIRDMLERHEGNEAKVYKDTEGHPTAGVGHKLSHSEKARYPVGQEVPQSVRGHWSTQDSKRAMDYAAAKATKHGGSYSNPDVKEVMTDMSYQLGDSGTDGFKKMHEAIKRGDLNTAADELLDSKYATQAPGRAQENAEKLRRAGQ